MLTMNRLAFLYWAAQLLNINHTGDRPYVSRQIRSLNFGIDAEDYGRMRVHLFAHEPTLVSWLQSLPAAQGPLPAIVFRRSTPARAAHVDTTALHGTTRPEVATPLSSRRTGVRRLAPADRATEWPDLLSDPDARGLH